MPNYEYSTSYNGDTHRKIFLDFENLITDKEKLQHSLDSINLDELTNLSQDEQNTILKFIKGSIIERKDLEVLHDRIIELIDKNNLNR